MRVWTLVLVTTAAVLPHVPGTAANHEECDPYMNIPLGHACIATCYVHIVPGYYAVCLYRNFDCSDGFVTQMLVATGDFLYQYTNIALAPACDPEKPPCHDAPGTPETGNGPARQNIRICGNAMP